MFSSYSINAPIWKKIWSRWGHSKTRPSRYECDAPPPELHRHLNMLCRGLRTPALAHHHGLGSKGIFHLWNCIALRHSQNICLGFYGFLHFTRTADRVTYCFPAHRCARRAVAARHLVTPLIKQSKPVQAHQNMPMLSKTGECPLRCAITRSPAYSGGPGENRTRVLL